MAFPSPIDFGGIAIEEGFDHDDAGSDNTSILDDSEPKPGEPAFFDLRPPQSNANHVKLEDVVKRLFSPEHLHFIIADQALFYRLCIFVNRYKPQLAPTLVRYLEMRKAMKAIEYANAVARKIRWPSHTDHYKFSRLAAASTDVRFDDYASRELQLLCTDVLPAFISHSLVNFVVDCVARDITGEAVPIMQDLVGSLAEIFCLTDPSLPDNPIIYASEEFHRTTQYGTTYAIDRNCRFLQGPGTDKNCTARLREAISKGQEICETLLNYRRDGSPFVNLLMCAPLFDDKGAVRYFIGAQVDVTGLIGEGQGIESFRALLQSDSQDKDSQIAESSNGEGPKSGETNGHIKTNGLFNGHVNGNGSGYSKTVKPASWSDAAKNQDMLDRLRDLSVMLSQDEADVVNKYSREPRIADEYGLPNAAETSVDGYSICEGRGGPRARKQGRRIIGSDAGTGGFDLTHLSLNNTLPAPSLPGVYKNYILTHPFPSLRILFVSPSLRIPGLLRTPLFSKLGGSQSTLSSLSAAFRDGAPATAKILWLPKAPSNSMSDSDYRSRQRWIRATPLLGSDDKVGVWMIILVPVIDSARAYDLSVGDMMLNSNSNGLDSQRASRATSRAGSVSSLSTTVSARGRAHERIVDRDDFGGDGMGSFMGLGHRRKAWVMRGGGKVDREKDKDMYADYLRKESDGRGGAEIAATVNIGIAATKYQSRPMVANGGRVDGI